MKSLMNPIFDRTSLGCRASCLIKPGFPRYIRPAFGLAALSFAWLITQEALAASFSNATPLGTARDSQTATLLSNGKLLVTGGQTNGGFTSAAAEVYDPGTGIWTATGSMNADRAHHTATVLPNGKILVAGGTSSANGTLSSAELYDLAVGTWTMTGTMTSERSFHTATLLPNGQVLVVGGKRDHNKAISDAELYDPVTGTWTATSQLNFARASHTATLLPNGQVLVAGGARFGRKQSLTVLAPRLIHPHALSSAEVYEPTTGAWTVTASLAMPRYSHTATLLPAGQVLVAGGTTNGSTSISGAELYNPATGTWTATNSLNTARFNHSATLLPNGTALVAGGTSDGTTSLADAETFDLNTGSWTTANSLNSARYSHTATLLTSGEVLIAGGLDNNQAFSSVERFNPAVGVWTNTGSLLTPTTYMRDILLANGKVLVIDVGGRSAEIYDPATGHWAATAGLGTFRVDFSATLLPNGKVLVAGGYNGNLQYVTTAQLYNPATGTWTPTGSLHHQRGYHAATLLADGEVLVAGGIDAFGSGTATAELYNPTTGVWTVTAPLSTNRYNAIAQLLPNGKVLVTGGNTAPGFYLTSSELYDPATGTWTNTGSLNFARTAGTFRFHATATLLPNGRVLAAGGFIYQFTTNGNLASAELFDPASGIWTMTGALPGPRSDHSATLLPDGKVLVAGGTDGTNNLTTALLYDPASGSWTTTAPLSAAHAAHCASLLPNGKVLVMAGLGSDFFASRTAELYEPGLGFSASSQPQITSILLPNSNGGVTVTGSGFRGISEGSNGTSQDSPADYPVVELMSVDSGQTLFLLATNWSTDSVDSPPVSGLPSGHWLATVFVNGIPSAGQIVMNATQPFLANSPSTMLAPSMETSGFRVSFAGVPGLAYTVQRAPGLSGPWTAIGTVTVGNSGRGTYLDTNPPAGEAFYRTTYP
jgi:uncharacterized delta-60 repeat protein